MDLKAELRCCPRNNKNRLMSLFQNINIVIYEKVPNEQKHYLNLRNTL